MNEIQPCPICGCCVLEEDKQRLADYAALLARHNMPCEAVEWERECNDASEAIYDDDGAKYDGEVEFENILSAACAEVDRLLEEK